MSASVARLRGMFVEVCGEAAAPPAARPARTFPSVVVLGASPRARAVTAGIAVALAGACDSALALAGAVGGGGTATGALAVAPAARRAVTRLRERGHTASARGRLVWLADRRTSATHLSLDADPAGMAAAACADLGRAAATVGAPAALALPLRRCAGLDRVLAWHDGIVVVGEPGATDGLTDLVLGSLAGLDVPVACIDAPRRLAAAVATLGIVAPAFATSAVEQLGLAPACRVGGRRS